MANRVEGRLEKFSVRYAKLLGLGRSKVRKVGGDG